MRLTLAPPETDGTVHNIRHVLHASAQHAAITLLPTAPGREQIDVLA